jgi:hypothetical protein
MTVFESRGALCSAMKIEGVARFAAESNEAAADTTDDIRTDVNRDNATSVAY